MLYIYSNVDNNMNINVCKKLLTMKQLEKQIPGIHESCGTV